MHCSPTSSSILMTSMMASLALLTSCGEHGTEPVSSAPDLTVDYEITSNGDLTAGLPIRLEPLHLPRLEELKQREALEAIVASGESEFAQILALKDWVSSQWPAGYPDPYPPWDAITVLDWIRGGVTGGFCAQYAQVLLQSLAALGLQARYVEIGSVDNPYAHFLTEVWSNEFNKWVLLDPDFNLHFERNGVPLSALEIHDALVRSQLSDVDVILGTRRAGHSNPASWPLRTADLYYYLRVHLNANHLAAPYEHPFHRYNDMVEWIDEFTVPWEFSEVESEFAKVRLTNLQTNDRAAFEGRMNQVKVTVESNAAGTLDIRFENNLHGFRGYEIRKLARRGQIRAWQSHPVDTLLWSPTRDTRILEVRGINQSGVPGPISRISVPLGGPDK